MQRGWSTPGIGGAAGREPVAMTAALNWMSSAFSTDMRVRAGEAPAAQDDLDAVGLEQPGQALDDAGHDAAAIALDLLEVEIDVAEPDAELREVPLRVVVGVRRLDHRLGRDAADVQARAANRHRLLAAYRGGLLDDDDGSTQLRGADRRWIAARP